VRTAYLARNQNICVHECAKQELGWQPRPAETTIVETAESLRDLGLLES
jgi:hypothetical protein